jgi:hypothetical protein
MTCPSSWLLRCLRWGELKAAAWYLFYRFMENFQHVEPLGVAKTMREQENRQITALQHHGVICRGVVDVADVGNMQRRERRSDEVSSCDHMLAVQVNCRISAWGTENGLCDLTGVFVLHVKVSCWHTFIVSLSNALSAAHQTQLWCATWRLAQVVYFRHAPALWQAAFLLLHTTLLVVQLLLLLVLLLLLLL